MSELLGDVLPPLDETAPAPTILSVVKRIGWRGVPDALVPVALFVLLNSTVSVVAAMAATTGWTLLLTAWRAAHGRRTGALIWIGTAYAIVRGVAGMLTQSPLVYFGPGIAQNGLIAVGFLVSVAVRRPAVGYIAPIVYPFQDYVRAHPAYRRAFSHLTLLWGFYLLGRFVLDVWLVTTVDASTFVLVRSLTSWPGLILLFWFSLRYPRRVFRREPDLLPYVEAAEHGAKSARRAAVVTGG